MKKIKLTQGKFALVDNKDFEWLSKYKWYPRNSCGIWYASRTVWIGKKSLSVQMGREVLNLKRKDGKFTDHINGNGLDNRRCNLRICTSAENTHNQKRRDGSSKYRGVFWDKDRCKWRAIIVCNYKSYHLGRFDSEVEAAKAYDAKAVELYGEFARLNFPKMYKKTG